MRGKLGFRRCAFARRRLIPAYAGKTRLFPTVARFIRAHPRVCGENKRYARMKVFEAGSSPRVRGKRISMYPSIAATGLIPACAGKTSSWAWGAAPMTAHPRVCGENTSKLAANGVKGGSSPRVRGKLLIRSLDPGLYRLIPACAGKTRPSSPLTA